MTKRDLIWTEASAVLFLSLTAALVPGMASAIPASLPAGPDDGELVQADWAAPGDGKSMTAQDWMSHWQLEVQTLRHQVTVGDHGNASHAIALELPSVGRLQPALSLAYSSGGGAGRELPDSWTLNGVSSIRRPIGPAFGADEWSLDGQLLIPDATFGPARYRTRSTGASDQYAEYVVSTDTWLVTSVDGIVRTYEPADAGGSGPDGTLQWRVVRERDPSGNVVDFTYHPDGRLAEVSWGGNDAAAVGHLGRVRFTYVARLHPVTVATSGVLEEYGEVVDVIGVEMRENDTNPFHLVREYVLDVDSADGRTQLVGFDVVGHRGGLSTTEPGERFSYSESHDRMGPSRPDLASSISTTHSYSYRGRHQLFAQAWSTQASALVDWNGDGLVDKVSVGGSTWTVKLQELTYGGGDWGSDPAWGAWASFPGPAYDVAETVSEDWSNAAFSSGAVGAGPRHIYTTSQLMDVDGDGFPDMVISDDSSAWEVWYGTGQAHWDGPYMEFAPELYAATSLAADADLFPAETCSRQSGLIDLNGDGWADYLDTSTQSLFFHLGGRGAGWSTTDRFATHGPSHNACWTETDKLIVPDPVFAAYGVGTSQTTVDETRETKNFYDLNGDGLMDEVFASSTHWKVAFGRRNGGFGPRRAWAAPLPFSSVTQEAYPDVLVPNPMGGPMIHHAGHDGRLVRGLLDVDADGDLDYVDMDHGYWYANIKDGFDLGPRALPGWWPAELSLTVPGAGHTTSSPVDSFSSSSSKTTEALKDMDGDGIVDWVTPMQTILGEAEDKPALLISVETAAGGTTEVAYASASYAAPSGDGFRDPGGDTLLRAPGRLVSSVSTRDPITGAHGDSQYSYRDAVVRQGEFLGFEGRRRTDLEGGLWRLHEATTYELQHGLSPMLITRAVQTDQNLKFAPSLSRGSSPWGKTRLFEVHFWTDVTRFHRLRETVHVTEDGEDTGPARTHNVYYGYDTNGALDAIAHDGGGATERAFDLSFTYTHGANAATGFPLTRLAQVEKSGYDPLNATSRLLSVHRQYFDGNTSITDAPTAGLLTRSEVSGGWYDNGEAVDASFLQTLYTRGSFGEVTVVSMPATGESNTLVYDLHGAVAKTQTNALGHTQTATFDAYGMLQTTQDANGIGERFERDALNRVVSQGRIDASAVLHDAMMVSYGTQAYAVTGQPQFTYTTLLDGMGGPDSERVDVYDGLGQVTQQWGQDAHGDWLVTDLIHDLYGNLKSTSHAISAFGAYTFTGLHGIPFQMNHYDAFGSVREGVQDQFAGLAPTLSFHGQVRYTDTVDPAGLMTRVYRDIHNRITKVDKDGGDGTWVTVAEYEWDGEDHLVRYIDGNFNVYEYSYDAAGRMRESWGPDIGLTRFDYVGTRMSFRTDATGGSAQWTRDAAGRIQSLWVSDPIKASGSNTYTFAYDAVFTGKLDTISDGHSITSFVYDDFGRVQSRDIAYADGTVLVESVGYDLQDQLLWRVTPSGSVVDTSYAHGWRAADTVGGVVIDYDYGRDGELLSAISNNGVVLDYGYTTPLWPDHVGLEQAGKRWELAYSWLDNGYLQSRTAAEPMGLNPAEIFKYDPMGQLVRVDQPHPVEMYAYDNAGNLTFLQDATGASWTYAGAGSGAAVGNQIEQRTDGVVTETTHYDPAGRVSQWSDGFLNESYVYDGLGRLRGRYEAGALTLEVNRDGNGDIVSTSDGATVRYLFGDFQLDGATGDTSEQLTAHLGTKSGARHWQLAANDGQVRYTIDDAGNAISDRELDAYGRPRVVAGDPWTMASFGGLDEMGSRGLLAAGPRHLAPRDGSWLQPEPLLISGNMADLANPRAFSTLRYAANAPTVFTDPTGMSPDPKKRPNGLTTGCAGLGADCPSPKGPDYNTVPKSRKHPKPKRTWQQWASEKLQEAFPGWKFSSAKKKAGPISATVHADGSSTLGVSGPTGSTSVTFDREGNFDNVSGSAVITKVTHNADGSTEVIPSANLDLVVGSVGASQNPGENTKVSVEVGGITATKEVEPQGTKIAHENVPALKQMSDIFGGASY